MTREIRLFAALGPGDVVGARRARLAGQAVNETSIAFSEQLFAYCRLRNIRTLAISSHARADALIDGPVAMENRAKPFYGRGGLRFHLSLVLYGLYLAARARRFGATVAVIDSGTSHYFALAPFRLLGISVLVNLHNVLWPRGFPPRGRLHRAIRRLNALFFKTACAGAIGVSPECQRQISAQSHAKVPFFEYRCQFRSVGFKVGGVRSNGVFRIAFVGRAERNKGLLDIPDMAHQLRGRATVPVMFEVCGDGPALAELRSIVLSRGLENQIVVHGRLERQALLDVYSRCDAVIVPTRSDFTEGMPQVCAEAVLSGIPIVTSEVANAFDVVGPATLQAVTDDIESYVGAILSMIEDKALYNRLRAACPDQARQFVDRSQSYPAALDRLLETVAGQARMSDYDQIFSELD
jgi:glycogen synthase